MAPRHRPTSGSPISTITVISTATLPVLLNHLPTAKPIAASTICAAISTTDAANITHLLLAIQAAAGTA